MNKEEKKIANRVLKELGVYCNYYRELDVPDKEALFLNCNFKGFISCGFVWNGTKKGHRFWQTINEFFQRKSPERMEKYKLFEEVSTLKKHLKSTKKHDFK